MFLFKKFTHVIIYTYIHNKKMGGIMYFLFRNTAHFPLITLLAPIRLFGQVFFFPRPSFVVFLSAFKRT